MRKIMDVIDWASLWIAGISIGISAVVIILQVIVRYGFGFSFSWGDELARFGMIWGCFFAMGPISKRGDLAGVEFFRNKLSEKYRLTFIILAELCGLFFTVLLTVYGIKEVLSPSIMDQLSSAMRLPMCIPYMSIPIGAAVVSIHTAERIFKHIRMIGGITQCQ